MSGSPLTKYDLERVLGAIAPSVISPAELASALAGEEVAPPVVHYLGIIDGDTDPLPELDPANGALQYLQIDGTPTGPLPIVAATAGGALAAGTLPVRTFELFVYRTTNDDFIDVVDTGSVATFSGDAVTLGPSVPSTVLRFWDMLGQWFVEDVARTTWLAGGGTWGGALDELQSQLSDAIGTKAVIADADDVQWQIVVSTSGELSTEPYTPPEVA